MDNDFFERTYGFYTAGEWRFGPLYALISIAGQFLLEDLPFALAEIVDGAPEKTVLLYTGTEVTGDSRMLELVGRCLPLLRSELTPVVLNWEPRELGEQIKETLLKKEEGGAA